MLPCEIDDLFVGLDRIRVTPGGDEEEGEKRESLESHGTWVIRMRRPVAALAIVHCIRSRLAATRVPNRTAASIFRARGENAQSSFWSRTIRNGASPVQRCIWLQLAPLLPSPAFVFQLPSISRSRFSLGSSNIRLPPNRKYLSQGPKPDE